MPNPTPTGTETPGGDVGETLQEADKPSIGTDSQTEMTVNDQELARYFLAGSLTEEERVMIEQRIVTDPAFLEEV